MKLYIFLLLIINLLNAENQFQKSSNDDKLVIGYSGSPSSVDYWKKLKDSLFNRAKELNVITIDFTSSKFTHDAQKRTLDKAIKLDLDGMIIGANSSKIANYIEQFKKKNIPVIAVNREIKHDWISTSIKTNNAKAVELAANFIKDKLKNKKEKKNKIIIFCGDLDNKNALLRASIPSEILKKEGYDIKIYYSKEWSSKNSLNSAIKEYSRNAKDIIASFSCYAGGSIASVNAAEFYKIRPLQVGFDMDKNMKKMIEEGRLDATIVQNPKAIGKIAIESMIDLLKKDASFPKNIDIPARLVTKENVKSF